MKFGQKPTQHTLGQKKFKFYILL